MPKLTGAVRDELDRAAATIGKMLNNIEAYPVAPLIRRSRPALP